MIPRLAIVVGILLFAGCLVLPAPLHSQTPPPYMPCSGINRIDKAFPTAGPEETHWLICWQAVPKNGLVINWAFFRPSPSSRWIRIFWDARISEIFVPYHSGWPRYFDITDFAFSLVPVGLKDCPAALGGTPLGGNVCLEVHDRGLAWKSDSNVRRGEAIVLWGALGAANYNYVIEWTFQDDGVIMGRVGATSANLPGVPFEPHVHNPMWRLDIDLDGFWGDSVNLDKHSEPLPGLIGTDSETVIATEAGEAWDPHAFTSLDVHDATLMNGRGDHTSLHIMPMPTGGLSRHNEDFTQQDFWVSVYNPSEMSARYITSYITPAQSAAPADIVVWYKGSVHHHPRDEDGKIVNGYWNGVALVMWTGFMIKPNNLFDSTPLYP